MLKPRRFVYHGTTEAIVPQILKTGLQPRKNRGKGNWSEHPSNPRAVYLTSAYPVHYAQAANDKAQQRLAIFEVDLNMINTKKMVPDEDFLEQATRNDEDFHRIMGPSFKNLKKRTIWFRNRMHKDFQKHWPLSLSKLGNCAHYGPIHPLCLTRYALLPAIGKLALTSDPTITLMNFKLLGEFYIRYVEYIFEGTIDMTTLDPEDTFTRERIEQMLETVPRVDVEVHRVGYGVMP